MQRSWIIALILVGVALASLTVWLLFPARCDKPVTCKSDEQCGGQILGENFCKDDAVWSHAQINTCQKQDACNAVCNTKYTDVLVEECKTGCLSGHCRLS